MYDKLIQYIKVQNTQCKIMLCNSCPRGDTSTTELNEIIQSLTEHYGASLIDQDKAFHDRKGYVIHGYYDTDSIHLSSSGVKHLLRTINKEAAIVNDFGRCFYGRRQANRAEKQQQRRKQQSRPSSRQHFQERWRDDDNVTLCYKCGEENHDTKSCKHKKQLACFTLWLFWT